MKKNYTLITATILISVNAWAQNVWVQKANYTGNACGGAIGFSVGNNGYLITGEISPTNFISSGKSYSQGSNVWSSMASYGGGSRVVSASFSIGTKGYVGTGNGLSGEVNDFWEYDPSTNVWTQKANYGGGARRYAVGFAIGSFGYIGTGSLNSSTLNTFYQYDPSLNTWTAKANFAGTPRKGAVGFSIGTKGYIGTGQDNTGNFTNDFWQYDPTLNAWTQKANFGGTARWAASGFSIGNYGYIGTGQDNSGAKTDFYEYNPSNNTWVQKANYPGQGTYFDAAFSINTKGYFGTGFPTSFGGYTNDLWEYSPSLALSATTTHTNPLCNGQCTAAATATPSGGQSPYTYLWAPGGQTTPGVTGLCASVYTVTITDALSNTFSSVVTITQPTVLIGSTSSTFTTCGTCCDGTVSVTATGGTPAYTYVWTPGNFTTQNVSGLCNGTYTVCVTDANGCTTCSTVNVSFNVGLQNSLIQDDSLNIYPNPFNENISIQINNLNGQVNFCIYDELGQLMKCVPITNSTTEIDTHDLSSGIYLFQIKTNDQVITKKLVKTN